MISSLLTVYKGLNEIKDVCANLSTYNQYSDLRLCHLNLADKSPLRSTTRHLDFYILSGFALRVGTRYT